MLELARKPVRVVGVFADPAVIEGLDASAFRIAPDEAMLVGEPDAPPGVSVEDPHAVVLDVTDGWAVFTLSGDRTRAAFAQLSSLRLPDEGFVQGDVVRVPARVIVERDRLQIFVPAMRGEQARSRILARCANLAIREVAPA